MLVIWAVHCGLDDKTGIPLHHKYGNRTSTMRMAYIPLTTINRTASWPTATKIQTSFTQMTKRLSNTKHQISKVKSSKRSRNTTGTQAVPKSPICYNRFLMGSSRVLVSIYSLSVF